MSGGARRGIKGVRSFLIQTRAVQVLGTVFN